MNRRAWILFATVAVLWGIPYLLIKIAIEDLSPLLVVFGRVAIAALVLVPIAAAQGTLSSLRRHLGPVTFLGLVHIVGPFLLITYGEVHISSSLTGLLIAIEPVLIALLMLRTDRLTPVRGAGLALGLVGVAVLVGLDISGDRLGLLGAGMILLATFLYAVATVYVQRKASEVPPTALVAGTTTVSTLVLAPFAAFALPTTPVSGGSWAALLALGLLCTAVALLAFYRLIGEAGPGRAGLVTYANPVVAVLLGVAILNEPLHTSTLLGFALIVAGCWLSTRPTRTETPQPAPEPARSVDLATASR
ncbi:Permease of the drug/metabolite transporter (DMT) superfamily [Asanoa hainanensis]|uniref:Permease of the drug/metabolite transporter (DMT) superfamily n=1 Tax=Asanoa hainanensis TaxID=560556 RepID=A0A239H3G1_9ACTN|nr:DMT family transporter [Asanoa hainanensis]SNS75920.1 Permease of the drug/metabolite transporter (DMT) superfamily [Asanoa hainanensis]